MDGDLYDEFGNYIGPELSESEEDEELAAQQQGFGAAPMEEGGDEEDEEEEEEEEEGAPGTAIVLHEDKKYYPSAEELYGAGTETLVQEEDAQPLEVPIIAPVVRKRIDIETDVGAAGAGAPPPLVPHAAPEFLAGLLGAPELIRNVAVVGHLHHGKTVLMDMLVEQTHDAPDSSAAARATPDAPLRFTDTRLDERARGVSLKAVPMTLVLEDGRGKSYAVSAIDCPGHPNFEDEVAAGLRLSDGVLLVVDAVEGVMVGTERAVRAAAAEGLPIALVLTKVDRLITELKLPPSDAYHKLRHTIQEVNTVISAAYGGDPAAALDPLRGNVAFAAPLYGWCFTLKSFAALHAALFDVPIDSNAFAARLWGDAWMDPEDGVVRRRPPSGHGASVERTFVQFVLEPLYKIHSVILGEDEDAVAALASELGVRLPPRALGSDVKPLLKTFLSNFFGSAAGLVDMIVSTVPSPRSGAVTKVQRCYTGPLDDAVADAIRACDPMGPLVAQVCKLIPKSDCSSFDSLARLLSGSVRPGDVVRVLGEAFSPDDEEDSCLATVSAVWSHQARYRVPLERGSAGAWVLLQGLDDAVSKTATLVPEHWGEGGHDVHIMRPLRSTTARPVVKLAAEPLNPGELPKMVEGLRRLSKSYPALRTKVEESGEHAIFGTGELYLDSAMKDLREAYADVEIKVADPVVTFSETVVESSSLKCFADSQNKKVRLTMVAEPLDKGLAEDIEGGAVSLEWPKKRVATFFKESYDWDALAARSVWAFGPDLSGPNVLLDDTLPDEVDKNLVNAVKASIVQGFQWGAREGPLCDEPMRSVKFRLTDAVVPERPLERGGGQVIPTARRAALSSFLMATPRLMEPVYYVEIQTPADCVSAIYTVLAKRRGHVTADIPKPGTPVFIVKAFLPVMESFGFETDLRYHTQGQAFCLSVFDHWQVVPGDPLDRSVVLRPLEPAPLQALARDFMVKTRRRKGMTDDVSIAKFFDSEMLASLAQNDLDMV